jgi:hypothetical protein
MGYIITDNLKVLSIETKKCDNLLHNAFEWFKGLNCLILTPELSINMCVRNIRPLNFEGYLHNSSLRVTLTYSAQLSHYYFPF